ncbi:endoribonuclease XendoU, partial [Ancylostoma duodenale]
LYEEITYRFFYYVDPSLLQKPSYSQFIAMMNNFNRKGGVDEPRVSPQEESHEISTFLTTILASRPWQILYSFLQQKGHPFAQSPYTFRSWIEQLWFKHYSRSKGRADDTSSFEHVFIGE